MTDKEIKHLNRAELIDIIYEQQKRLEEQETRSQELQKKLDEKRLHVSEAGSIAEAALKVNGVFESVQAAADQYLISIEATKADIEQSMAEVEGKRQKILSDAEIQANGIIRQAEIKADAIVETAEKQSEEKWTMFEHRANELIAAHKELQLLMGTGDKE